MHISCIQKEITIPQVIVSADTQVAEEVSARRVLYYRCEQVNAIDRLLSMVKDCTEKKPPDMFREHTDATAGYGTRVHLNILYPTYLAGLMYRCSPTPAQQTQ
jgi:hypothetical protein